MSKFNIKIDTRFQSNVEAKVKVKAQVEAKVKTKTKINSNQGWRKTDFSGNPGSGSNPGFRMKNLGFPDPPISL